MAVSIQLPEGDDSFRAGLFRMEQPSHQVEPRFEPFVRVDLGLGSGQASFVPEFWADGKARYAIACQWEDRRNECYYLFYLERE